MSGVYIKGMQMPERGAERCIVIRGDGSITTFVGAPIDYAKAIPFPDHGRLIDADALYRRIKTECNPYGKPTIDYDEGNRVMHVIIGTPTIIPASGGE